MKTSSGEKQAQVESPLDLKTKRSEKPSTFLVLEQEASAWSCSNIQIAMVSLNLHTIFGIEIEFPRKQTTTR